MMEKDNDGQIEQTERMKNYKQIERWTNRLIDN